MTIWHDLRTKPPKWKDVLVMTYSKTRKFRICHYTGNVWVDSGSGRTYIPPYKMLHRPRQKNIFRVKRWTYLEDLEKL